MASRLLVETGGAAPGALLLRLAMSARKRRQVALESAQGDLKAAGVCTLTRASQDVAKEHPAQAGRILQAALTELVPDQNPDGFILTATLLLIECSDYWNEVTYCSMRDFMGVYFPYHGGGFSPVGFSRFFLFTLLTSLPLTRRATLLSHQSSCPICLIATRWRRPPLRPSALGRTSCSPSCGRTD